MRRLLILILCASLAACVAKPSAEPLSLIDEAARDPFYKPKYNKPPPRSFEEVYLDEGLLAALWQEFRTPILATAYVGLLLISPAAGKPASSAR